jgi:hypothetical protein
LRDGAIYDYIGTSDVTDISKVTLNKIDIQDLLGNLFDNGGDITPDDDTTEEDVDDEMSITTTEPGADDFSYLLNYINIDTDNIDIEKTASEAIKNFIASCFNLAKEYEAVEYGKDNATLDVNAFVYNYYTDLVTALNSIKAETKLSEVLALKPVKTAIEFSTNSVDVTELYNQAMNYLEEKLTVQMSVGAMTQEQVNDLLSFPAPEESDTFYTYLVKLVASPKFAKLIGVLFDIDELQSGIVSIGDLTVGGLLDLANSSEGTKLSIDDVKAKINKALSTYISGDKTAFTITVPGKITSTQITIKDMKAVYSFKNKKLSGITTSATVTVAKVLGQTTASTVTSNATLTVNFYEEAFKLTDISSQIASVG